MNVLVLLAGCAEPDTAEALSIRPEECPAPELEPVAYDQGTAVVHPVPSEAGWINAYLTEELLAEHSASGDYIRSGILPEAAASYGSHAFVRWSGGLMWLASNRVDGVWIIEGWPVSADLSMEETPTYRAEVAGPDADYLFSFHPTIVDLPDGAHLAITLPVADKAQEYSVWMSEELVSGEVLTLSDAGIGTDVSSYLSVSYSSSQLAFSWSIRDVQLLDARTLQSVGTGGWGVVAPRSVGGWWVADVTSEELRVGWQEEDGHSETVVVSQCTGERPECPTLDPVGAAIVESGEGAIVSWTEYLGESVYSVRALELDATAAPVGCAVRFDAYAPVVQGLNVVNDQLRVLWTDQSGADLLGWDFNNYAWTEPLPLGP